MNYLRLSNLFPPFKLTHFTDRRLEALSILDVGCGNGSPTITKRWFPRARYVGLDMCDYNNSADDFAVMDEFVKCDLEKDSLECLPDESFDLIIMAHVIEHLHDAEHVVKSLSSKLQPNGRIYIECPTERSLRLPSGVKCLNFYDDPTHVRIYDPAAICRSSGLHVLKSGVRRDWRLVFIGLTAAIPKQLITLFKYRKPYGPLLWDILGFAQFAIASPTISLD